MSNCFKNPLGLEIGKEYWLRYLPAKDSPWRKVKITHFNDYGPWGISKDQWLNGLISGEYYEKRDITPETELQERARLFMKKKGLDGLINSTPFAEWFVEFYNEVEPDFNKNNL